MGGLCSKSDDDRNYSTAVTSTGARVLELPEIHKGGITGITSAGETRVLSGGLDKSLVLWDWLDRKVIHRWSWHTKSINRVAYAPKSGLSLCGSTDAKCSIWKDASSQPLLVLDPGSQALKVSGLTVSEAQQQVGTGSRDYHVRVWDLNTAQQVTFSCVNLNVVTFLQWIPTGEPSMVQTSEDLMVRVWDARNMAKEAQKMNGHVNIPLCCDVSQDGNYILTCSHGFDSHGCEGRVWDRRMGRQVHTLSGHTESTNACVWVQGSNCGPKLAPQACTVSADRSLRIWDCNSESVLIQESFSSGRPDAPLTAVASLPPPQDTQSGRFQGDSHSQKLQSVICAGNFEGAIEIWGLSSNSHGDIASSRLAQSPI